jgi:hypothetical protein
MPEYLVWPRLFECELAVREDVLAAKALPKDVPTNVDPTAIRWRLSPVLGVPRQPFQVWRRPRFSVTTERLTVPSTSVSGEQRIEWGRRSLLELRCTATPAAGGSLTLQALDEFCRPIVGERVTVSGAANVRLRTPNICALRVTGTGTVANFDAVAMINYARNPGSVAWTLVETVGLPVERGETPPSIYDSNQLQGRPANLKSGIEAALERLGRGVDLYPPPADKSPDGTPAPLWPALTARQVLDEVRARDSGQLGLILETLGQVDPNSFDASQLVHEQDFRVGGLRQPGVATQSQPAVARVRVAQVALLGAAIDSWTALALGFGTTDFPAFENVTSPFVEPPRPRMPQFDYMVTVGLQLPFGLKLDLAAIASPSRFNPQDPVGLEARNVRHHRPLKRDEPASEAVELRWARLPGQISPHAYALGVLEGNAPPVVLNERRFAGGFVPYVPAQRPGGDLDNEKLVSFVDTDRPLPLKNTRTDRYVCAALDVFGRWSNWISVSNVLSPLAVGRPQVSDIAFTLNESGAVGRQIPASLQATIVWDWQDRSPELIELSADFFNFTTTPPPPSPGVQRRVNGAREPLRIVFSATGAPSLVGAKPGDSVVEAPAESGDGEARRYRLKLQGFTLDFSSSPRLSLSISARAAEHVNPAVSGTFCTPATARASDPLPAAPPLVPSDPPIIWTALPDATDIARAHLTLPSVPGAAGYIVYQASEMGVRTAGGLDQPAASAPLEARAQDLRDLLSSTVTADRARAVFTRLNRALLPTPELEVSLPSVLEGLFAFTVTSVTSEQIESARSAPIIVAVSRRVTPGAPRLRVEPDRGGGLRVRVETGLGAPPTTVELFRTTSEVLASDIDLMGPPVAGRNDPRWTTLLAPDGSVQSLVLVDQVTQSWRPYLYRAIAFGPDDAAHGRLAGASRPSAVAGATAVPSIPPDLDSVVQTIVPGQAMAQVQLRSAAEFRASRLGAHRLEVLTVNTSGVRPVTTRHLQVELPTVPLANGVASQQPGVITRTPPGPDGRCQYATFVPTTDRELVVRVIDPRGRVTESAVELIKPPPPEPPDLVDLQARIVRNALTVSVRSAAPITRPASGEFSLELFETRPVRKSLVRARLHEIQTTPATGRLVRSGPGADHRFTYSIQLPAPTPPIQEIVAVLTDPSGLSSDLRRQLA